MAFTLQTAPRMRIHALWPLALCLASGCDGGAPGTDPGPFGAKVELSAWFSSLATVECERLFRCCDAGERQRLNGGLAPDATQEACVKRREGAYVPQARRWEDFVHSGKLLWHAEAAAECLTKLRAASCGADVGTPSAVPSVCSPFISGTAPQGASCLASYECASANCPERSVLGPPVCTAGPRCGSHGECGAGAYCAIEEYNRCRPHRETHAPCNDHVECGPGSFCPMNFAPSPFRACAKKSADGEPCSENPACHDGSFCRFGGGSPVCVRKGAEGVTCSPYQPSCLDGLFCGPGSRCRAVLGDGAPCSSGADCQSGSCRPADGGLVCAPLAPLCDGL